MEQPAQPGTRRSAWRWLGLALGGFALGELVVAVLLPVVASLQGEQGRLNALLHLSAPPAWVDVTELVGLWIGFLVAVLVASKFDGTGSVVRDMHLRFKRSDLIVGPAVGLAGQLVLVPLLYLPLIHAVPHLSRRLDEPAHNLTTSFSGGKIAVLGALTVGVVPVVEELFFRGLLLRSLVVLWGRAGRTAGPVLAIVTTGVLFGFAHAEPLQLLGLAAFGIVLAVLAYAYDRLGPSILAHATFNLVAVAATSVQGRVH